MSHHLDLNPTNAQIFRLTHRRNVGFIASQGIHCPASPVRDPGFVAIGNPDLIVKRKEHALPAPCQGTLSNYVPFYFTPSSIMMYNIITGMGVPKQNRSDLVIFVSSIHKLLAQKIPFVFCDRHAYLANASFYDNLSDLDKIDWQLLCARDFRRDPNDPGKFERYQAEALVFGHLPVEALVGVACLNQEVATAVSDEFAKVGKSVQTKPIPSWFFS